MIKNILESSKKIGLVVFVAGFTACSNAPENNEAIETDTHPSTEQTVDDAKNQLEKDILKTEEDLKAANGEKAFKIRRKLIEFYASYVENFPGDNKSAEMAFKAGNEAVNVEDFKSALHFYSLVEKRYPDYQKRPEAVYLQGFICDTYTSELGVAKEKYLMLIDLYPSHVLAEQAKMSIANLGMSDEELIKQFEAQNN